MKDSRHYNGIIEVYGVFVRERDSMSGSLCLIIFGYKLYINTGLDIIINFKSVTECAHKFILNSVTIWLIYTSSVSALANLFSKYSVKVYYYWEFNVAVS